MSDWITRIDHARGLDYYLEVRLAQARLETWQEEMTMRYHLGEQDSLDIKSGIITRKESADGEDHRERGGEDDSSRDQTSLERRGQGDDFPERPRLPE